MLEAQRTKEKTTRWAEKRDSLSVEFSKHKIIEHSLLRFKVLPARPAQGMRSQNEVDHETLQHRAGHGVKAN
jgi:hypothetical protein